MKKGKLKIEFKNGGKLSFEPLTKLETIRFERCTGFNRRFELWINENSLSYLSIDELLDIRDSINDLIKEL